MFPVPPQEPFNQWRDLACIVAVDREGTRGPKPHAEERFYICSEVLSAKDFAAVIRAHWSIENGLHWPKDVLLKEDACPTRAGQAPQNLALMRSLTVTLFRLRGFQSIKAGLRRFAHDITALCGLLE